MEKFEFKVDTNTLYVKILRFIGAFLVGMVAGVTIIKFRSGSDIEWMNTVSTTCVGFILALFPGAGQKKSLTIDEEGIHLHHYTFSWLRRDKEKFSWANISAISVDKHAISIKNSIGAREKIKLPYHTKEQVANLKSYLRDITTVKKVTYLA